jgi:hypothetical protein
VCTHDPKLSIGMCCNKSSTSARRVRGQLLARKPTDEVTRHSLWFKEASEVEAATLGARWLKGSMGSKSPLSCAVPQILSEVSNGRILEHLSMRAPGGVEVGFNDGPRAVHPTPVETPLPGFTFEAQRVDNIRRAVRRQQLQQVKAHQMKDWKRKVYRWLQTQQLQAMGSHHVA